MSTVGTLYDETVKFGSAKLLQVSTAAGAASIDFIAPLALTEYDTFMFDLDNIIPGADNLSLLARVSVNGGATWLDGSVSGNQYYYTYLYQPSNVAPSSFSSNQLGGASLGYLLIAYAIQAPSGAYGVGGRVYFNLGPNRGVTGGHRQFEWQTLFRSAGYMLHMIGGGANVSTAPNGIRFYIGGSTIYGTIRCYGLKKGT